FCDGDWGVFDRLLRSSPPGNGGKVGLYLDLPEITPEIKLTGRFRRGPRG
ncbi:unnamed protein product, partial [Discosporangium mesarthrocarpum]